MFPVHAGKNHYTNLLIVDVTAFISILNLTHHVKQLIFAMNSRINRAHKPQPYTLPTSYTIQHGDQNIKQMPVIATELKDILKK